MFSTSENAHFDGSNVRPFFYGHSLIHQPYRHLWYQNPFHHHPFYMHGAGLRSENPYFPHSVVLNEYPGFLVPPSPRPTRVNSRYTSPMFLHMARFGHHGNFGKKMKNKDTQTDPQWTENKWKKQDIHLEADSHDRGAGISLYDLAYGRAMPENVVQHNLLSRSSCESKNVFYEDGITCNDEQGAAVLAEQCLVIAGNKQTLKPGSGKKMSLGKEMKGYGAVPRILSPSDKVKPGDKTQLIRGQNPLGLERCKSAEDVHEEWSDEEWEPLDLCEEAVHGLSPEPIAQHPFSDGERKLDTGIGNHGSPQKCLPSPTWLDSFDRFADKAVSCNMSMFEKNLYRVVPPEEYLAWCKKASRNTRKSHSGMATNLGKMKGYRNGPRVLSPSDKLKARDKAQSIKSQNSLSSGGSKTAEDVSNEEEWKPMCLRSEKCKPAENVCKEEEEEEQEEEWKPLDLQSEGCKSAENVSKEEEEEEEEWKPLDLQSEGSKSAEDLSEEEEKEEWKPLDLQSEGSKSAEEVHEEWELLDLCEKGDNDLSPQSNADHLLSNGERKLDTDIGSHGSPQKFLPSPTWLDSFDRFADKAVSCNMSMFEKNLYRVVPPEEYLAWCKKASRKTWKSRSGMATNLDEKKSYRAVPRALSPSDKLKARDQAQSIKSQNSLSSGGSKTAEDVSDEEWKPMYLRSERYKPAENASEEEWKPLYLRNTIKNGKCCKEIEETDQKSKNCAKIKRNVKGRKFEGLINSSNEKTTYVLKKNGALNILLSKDPEEWEMEEEAEDDEIYEVECLFQEVNPQDLLSSQGRFYLEVGKRIIWKPPKSSLSPQLIIWPIRNKHQLKRRTYESIPVVYKVKAQEGSGTMSGRLQKKYTTTKQEAMKSKQASHMLLKSNSERPKRKVCGRPTNKCRDPRK